MTDQGIYLRAPSTWPFKSATIPARLMPSRKTYARNDDGLVYVDVRDVSALLGLGFYLYGSSPTLDNLLAGLEGAGDPTLYLNAAGSLSTPACAAGLVLIDSGTITSPIVSGYFDIVVPSDFDLLQFTMSNITLEHSDVLAAVLGFGPGPTFLNNTSDFDSYKIGRWRNVTNEVARNPRYDAQLLLVDYEEDAIVPSYVTFDMFPGSSTNLATLFYQSAGYISGEFQTYYGPMSVAPDATITPTPARCTVLRIQVSGAGDTPPGNGNTINSGSWVLEGLLNNP